MSRPGRADRIGRVRMYLSSDHVGAARTDLVRLAGEDARVGVIANAVDSEAPDARGQQVLGQIAAVKQLGFRPIEVDLRGYFGERAEHVLRDLDSFELLWVGGGNVFVLRHALAESGADVAIRELLRADRLVYAGFGAGAYVVGPSLAGLEQVGDPGAVARLYGASASSSGLGLLAHVRLRDGEALVVDGDVSALARRTS